MTVSTITVISDEQRVVLERWVAAQKKPQSIAMRARIVLGAASGATNTQLARELGVSRPTVIMWRERFALGGPDALTETKPGRGRKPSITSAKVRAIVEATTQTTPPGHTHWSCRQMAEAHGVSTATVQRISRPGSDRRLARWSRDTRLSRSSWNFGDGGPCCG